MVPFGILMETIRISVMVSIVFSAGFRQVVSEWHLHFVTAKVGEFGTHSAAPQGRSETSQLELSLKSHIYGPTYTLVWAAPQSHTHMAVATIEDTKVMSCSFFLKFRFILI